MAQRVFTDRRCLEHRVPYGFPERAERLESILARLGKTRELADGGPHPGGPEAIASLHDPAYVESFARAVERGDGLLGSADNPLSRGSWDAARGAVDAALHAADWMMGETGDGLAEAFVAVRPPGHHAERGLAMGFCFFNNIAVAAEYLIRRHGLERVAVLDFDVHHGNGTQHLFESRSDVHFSSVHQWPFYPGTGAADETGRDSGEGTTLNVPLPAGSTDSDFGQAFERRLFPAIEAFAPQALLVSAGFDAWRGDPVGGMEVTAEAFAEWGRDLRDLAERVAGGRLLATLEGGYDLDALPELAAGYLAGKG